MAVQKEYYGHCIKGKLPWGIRCVFTQSQCQSCTLCAGFDESKPLHEQIDDWADMVHFHFPYEGELHKPFVCTEHSNSEVEKSFQSTPFICLLNMPKIITQLVMCIMDYTGLIMASQILSQKITAIFSQSILAY